MSSWLIWPRRSAHNQCPRRTAYRRAGVPLVAWIVLFKPLVSLPAFWPTLERLFWRLVPTAPKLMFEKLLCILVQPSMAREIGRPTWA
jgi:hypothetical protein